MAKMKKEIRSEVLKALTAEEILSDLETMQVCNVYMPLSVAKGDPESLASDSWWQTFESWMSTTKCLQLLHNDVLDSKSKLQKEKSKLEAEIRKLNQEIEKQQHEINNVLKNNTSL